MDVHFLPKPQFLALPEHTVFFLSALKGSSFTAVGLMNSYGLFSLCSRYQIIIFPHDSARQSVRTRYVLHGPQLDVVPELRHSENLEYRGKITCSLCVLNLAMTPIVVSTIINFMDLKYTFILNSFLRTSLNWRYRAYFCGKRVNLKSLL